MNVSRLCRVLCPLLARNSFYHLLYSSTSARSLCLCILVDSFQLGLVERQILEVLHGLHRVKTPCPKDQPPPEPQGLAEEDGSLKQRDIREDDVCPICQEELLSKRLPVAHCRQAVDYRLITMFTDVLLFSNAVL